MKIRNRMVDGLIILSLIGLLVVIFMPASFPMQYSYDGEVSRWGSRNEFLIYWMIPVAFGTIVKGYIAYRRNKEKLSTEERFRNEKPLLTSAVIIMAFFDIVLGYVVIRGFILLFTGAIPSSFHFINIIFGMVGIIIVVAGNYMPKIEYNSIIGFRNFWSTANETSWELTHRWIGGLCVILGFALVVFAVLFMNPPFIGMIFLAFIFSIVVVSYVLSYIAYRKAK